MLPPRMKLHADTMLGESFRDFAGEDAEQYVAGGHWRDRSSLDVFFDQVEEHRDKLAVVAHESDTGQTTSLTYGELDELVRRYAAGFLQAGVKVGDIVTVQLTNGWAAPAMVFAILAVGAVPNPIPITYREHEVGQMVVHARSRLLVVPGTFRGFSHATMAHRICEGNDETSYVVVGDDHDLPSTPKRVPWSAFAEAEAFASIPEDRRPGSDDALVMFFTSGTTGAPKAALHTHNTGWAAFSSVVPAADLTADDVCFMASTVGHMTGFYHGLILPLTLGQTVVYQDKWDPAACLDLVAAHGVTWTVSATTFALDLVESQKQDHRDLDSFRVFICGGAPIPPEAARDVDEHLGVSLVGLWGCSECGIATIHRLGMDIETLAASDGFDVEGQRLRIVDDRGDPVPDGEVGHLHVAGPGVFAGYYRQPERTAEAIAENVWFQTGDLGRRTPDGGIRIAGRSKDIIIRGGQNISAVEIENLLFSHPSIREIAVVPYPDDRLGEVVCAVVVPAGDPPTLEDVVGWLDERGVTKQYWPQKLEVRESLPRTPSGKVQKFKIRESLVPA